MQARMKNPAMVVPGAMAALQALGRVPYGGGVPKKTLDLVHLRVSQLNGCGVCLDLHVGAAKKEGETIARLVGIAGWREVPHFTDAERAALALAESATRLADQSDPVPDAVWNEAARHYDEAQLGALVLQIATVNLWNRLNVPTRQIAGAQKW